VRPEAGGGVPARRASGRHSEAAGAEASANLYSLVEAVKANGIEPFAYLRLLFERIPTAQCLEDFEALLPYRLDRGLLASS
jgi:hypothetical protein